MHIANRPGWAIIRITVYLVENVVRPFLVVLTHDPGFFQQVRDAARPLQRRHGVELQLHELAETGGIVVAQGLRVAETLHKWVGLAGSVWLVVRW